MTTSRADSASYDFLEIPKFAEQLRKDGWRTLRLFLLFSRCWLFLAPGTLLIAVGTGAYTVVLAGFTLGGVTFEVQTLLAAGLGILAGHQAALFALFTKSFAIGEGLLPTDARTARFFQFATLERGLRLGCVSAIGGMALFTAGVVWQWSVAFTPRDYLRASRWAIPGGTLTALGLQTILGSFFISILGLRRR